MSTSGSLYNHVLWVDEEIQQLAQIERRVEMENYYKGRRIAPFSGKIYNVYCDESCHLQNDRFKAMSIGAVWCPQSKVKEMNKRLIEIKAKHRIPKEAEVKWTKISPCNLSLYMDIVDYFFDDDDLSFRGLVVPDKSILRHEDFSQTHDQWYYKMYFTMLKTIFKRDSRYYVYIDIKDTHSGENAETLQNVCANDAYDFNHDIVKRVQPIRSDEVQLMQLVDILTGAIAFRHNHDTITRDTSSSKVALINRIIERSGISLTKTTLSSEKKVNLLVWRPNERL